MITTENLTKKFDEITAVENLTLEIPEGEVFGFLGPNGAGKTTTMRIITGYLMPTRGEVFVADYDMMSNSLEARRLIGYLPEIVPLYTEMTTREYLDFVARLRGVDRKLTKGRIDDVVFLGWALAFAGAVWWYAKRKRLQYH